MPDRREQPLVEPVVAGKAWSWGNRGWRLSLRLRDFDRHNLCLAMAGSGLTEGAFLRRIVQEGIAERLAELETKA